MNNCSFTEKRSVNARHRYQEWVLLSDTCYILVHFILKRVPDKATARQRKRTRPSHLHMYSAQDAVFRQHWVSGGEVKVLSPV